MRKLIFLAFALFTTAFYGQQVYYSDGLQMRPGLAPTSPIDGQLYIDQTSRRITQRDAGVWLRYALFSEIPAAQMISIASNVITLDQGGGTVDLTPYLDNTDSQNLSLGSNVLSITGGNNVNLSSYLDNTDSQIIDILNLNGSNLEISLSGDSEPTKTLDLSSLADGYVPPVNNSLNGSSDFTVTDANIHSGAAVVLNVLSASETIDVALTSVNTDEIDVLRFNVDVDGGTLNFTSANGFVSANIGSNDAVRVSGKGSVDFEETGANTGIFRVLQGGPNVGFYTVDVVAPTVTSAEVANSDTNSLIVTFSENVTVPNVTGLSLDGSWTGVTITGVDTVNDNVATFTLDTAIANGETGNFVYGATNTITDIEGNALASGSTSVTNSVTASCDPLAANPNSNMITGHAAAYCTDEANSTPTTGGGNGEFNLTGATLASISSTASGRGDYVLEVTAVDGTSDFANINHTLVNGEIYEYYMVYRSKTGSSHRYKFQNGNPDDSNHFFTNTTFVEESGEFTANSTTFDLRWYAASSGSAGDKIEFKFYMKLKND